MIDRVWLSFERERQTEELLELLLHPVPAPGAYGANRHVAPSPFAENPLALTSARPPLEKDATSWGGLGNKRTWSTPISRLSHGKEPIRGRPRTTYKSDTSVVHKGPFLLCFC